MKWWQKVEESSEKDLKVVVAEDTAAVYVKGALVYSGSAKDVIVKVMWARGVLKFTPTLTPKSEGEVAKKIGDLNL